MFATARNSTRRPGASFAFAIALMCGTALGVTALETPAHAQKKDKKDKKPKTDYSEGFMEAYRPLEAALEGDAPDHAAAKGLVEPLVAAMETDDDRYAGGGQIYNLGRDSGDPALQLRGMKLMLESGKVPAERVGSYNLTAYQLAAQLGDQDAARAYLTTMADMGYSFDATMGDGSTKTFHANDIRLMIAETYFEDGQYDAGLDYIKDQIDVLVAAGESFPENWIQRGLSVAYEGDSAQQAVEYGTLYVMHFPSETSWGDAIAIQRNMLDYDNQATLDLLRLAMRTNALRETRSYIDYIDAADARRLPGEVTRVVEAGIAAGKLEADDVYVAEARQIASGRIDADKADLPDLERDARAADATAVTASAAGDAFLSYGQAAKAEEFYRIALTKPGVDTQRVLTRLGIAQADQGKAEAVETFARIEGARRAIADLWAIYAAQNAAPATTAAATMDTPQDGTAQQ